MPSAANGYVKINVIADAKQAAAALNALGKSGQSLSQKLSTVGRGMTYGLTLPIAAAGAASVKLAYDFETSMNKIKTLVGANEQQMKRYEAAVLKMAPALGKAPKELADALYFVTSSGFKGASALRVLEASAKASAAGLGETATVADVVTSAVNAYGEKVLSAAKSTDIMLAAVREGKAEPEEFAQSMGLVISSASQLKVSFGEVAGAMAALTLKGQDASMAAVGLNQIMMNLLKPSTQAADALESIGLSAAKVRESLAKRGLVDTLQLLNEKFKGSEEKMAAVFGNARSLRAVFGLLGSSSGKLEKVIRKVEDASGDTSEAFKKMAETDTFKLKQAWSTLLTEGTKVGIKLLPIVTKVATAIGNLIDAFSKLSSGTQDFLLWATGITAALGPAIWTLGKTIDAIKGVGGAAKWAAKMLGLMNAAEGASGFAAATTKGGLSKGAVRGVNLVNKGAAEQLGSEAVVPMSMGAMVAAAVAALSPIMVATVMEKTQKYVEGRKGAGATSQQNKGAGGAFYGSSKGYGAGSGRFKGSVQNVDAIVQRLILDSGSSDKALNRTMNIIRDIQKAAAKGIDLKLDKDATITEMMQLRHELIDQLDITGKQADRILRAIFGKKYKLTADPKPMSKAVMQAQAKAQQLQDKLRDLGNMKVTPSVVVKTEGTGALAWVRDTIAGLKSKTVTLTMLKDYGYKPPDTAVGGVFTGRQLRYIGEAGPEAIIPLTKPARAAQVMQQAGLAGVGGGTININVVLPGGTSLIGTARQVGEAIAPHVARALGREAARAGRRR